MDRDFDSEILKETAHRPWRLPDRPWVMTQTWHDLLFAHWPVRPANLRAKVPAAFELDLFAGDAWIGIVPFRMTNVAPRGIPAVPWLSEFPELNVRTYVRMGDRPGVYFFSLDAGSAPAVRAARVLLNLPYYKAAMTVRPRDQAVEYDSRREGNDAPAVLRASYRPTSAPFIAAPGSLEYFLTERYCLYHRNRRGVPYRLEIHHPPWPLQPAEATIMANTMATVHGIALPDRAPILHFSKRQDMVAWAPTELG